MQFEAVITMFDNSEMNVHFTAENMKAALTILGRFFPTASQIHVKNL